MELPRVEHEKNKSYTMGKGGARASQAPLALAQSGSPTLYGTQQCPRPPALGPRGSRSAGWGWRGGPARLWLWVLGTLLPPGRMHTLAQSSSLVIWAREALRPGDAHPRGPRGPLASPPAQQHRGHTLRTLARPLPCRTHGTARACPVPREGRSLGMSPPHPAEAARSRRQPPPSCDRVRRAQGARPGLASRRPDCCPSCFSCGRAAWTRRGGGWGAWHHWRLVPATLCKSNPNPQKNTVVLSLRQIKTQPPLVPTLRAPQKEGAQARRPVALAQCVAMAVARPGSHAGPRHRQPPALHGSGQSARRAVCSRHGGRGLRGQECEQGLAREAAPGSRRGQVPSVPLGD